MTQQYWTDFHEEAHCEQCFDAVHFHFDEACPVCHAEHAGTDQYCSVRECIDDSKGVFECQECNTKFRILQYEYAADTEKDALIEVVT
jgi:hypothetical protein